jgi:hypothetical protein
MHEDYLGISTFPCAQKNPRPFMLSEAFKELSIRSVTNCLILSELREQPVKPKKLFESLPTTDSCTLYNVQSIPVSLQPLF